MTNQDNTKHLEATPDNIQAILDKAGSRIVSINFTKKNGELRHIMVNARMMQGLKGEDASESAQKATETRKAAHPELIPVMDFELYKAGTEASKCWRYVNSKNVIDMTADGVHYEFSRYGENK